MLKQMIGIVAVTGVVFALAFGTSNASAGTITDDFNTSHDYSGGNVAGTIWDGIRYDEGDISGVVANANTTSAGQLYLESANGSWSHGDNDGLLLYRDVAGDFVAEVQGISTTTGNWNGVGLMARLANPAADGDAGEDWVFLSYSLKFNQNRVRNVNNSATNEPFLGSPPQQFLQIERSGDNIILRRKVNAGDTWGTVSTINRTDLNGLPLQVGIWHANFISPAQSGILDNFSLSGPNVPDPAMLWRTGVSDNWTSDNWTTDGGANWGAPVADMEMVVNSGIATVSGNVSGTAATSLDIARDALGGTVEIASAGTLAVTGGVNVGAGGTLDVSGLLSAGALNVDLGGTLELGDGSMIVSPLTAETGPVTITVDGTLKGGAGNSELGDPLSGDWYFTNLALNGGVDCFFDYTFSSSSETDVDAGGTMVAIGDSVNIFGALEMGDGLTIRLVDGLAGGVTADGVDVALFKVIDGAAIDGVAPDVDGLWAPADLAKITILAPDGADYWTWDTLEYVDDEWVVLKGLVTVVPPPTWTATGGGFWNNAANWNTASAPGGNDTSVVFGDSIAAASTVVTDTPVTVAGITFDSANRYAIAGTGALTLEDADDGVATVEVVQGTHEFQLPVTLGGNAEVDVVNGGDELIFNNALNLGGFTLEKVGAGLMSVNNVLTLGGGSIEVTAGSLGGSGTVGGNLIVNAAATLAPGNSIGTLNVEGDLTLVSASIYEWEVGQGGQSDTIHISDGAVDLDNFVLMILDADGYVANASVRLPVFTYDSDSTVDLTGFANDFANFDATGLDETWTVGDLSLTDDEEGLIYLTGLSGGTLIGAVPGDANGDQIVDDADLTLFDAQLGFRGAGQSCDFDNDGDVDVDDFQIMKDNWGYDGTGGGAPLQLGTETPEPATMSVLAIGGLLVLRRRRKGS